jgi:hypothetical protein
MLIDNTRVPFTDIAKNCLFLLEQFMLGLKMEDEWKSWDRH